MCMWCVHVCACVVCMCRHMFVLCLCMHVFMCVCVQCVPELYVCV